jgi:hypothetical protein
MPTVCPPLDVSSLPYSRRQLIVVLPDQVVDAARQAEATAASRNVETDWGDIGIKAVIGLRSLTSVYGLAAEVAIEAIKAWAKARENGLYVLQVAQSEASLLQFPPGHPRDQTMYVAHPAKPMVYYTAATFHRMAFEHKFSEAIRLLMSLGATHISVEHVKGWSQEFSAKVSAGIPKAKTDAAAKKTESNASKLLFEANLKNDKEPILPQGLVWYEHEPTWQAVAAGRLEYGLQKFTLDVAYEDDFGVNAGLKSRAQKTGFELGGSFEDHESTIWKISGNFA